MAKNSTTSFMDDPHIRRQFCSPVKNMFNVALKIIEIAAAPISLCLISDYVRKRFHARIRAYLCNFMPDFRHLSAHIFYINLTQTIRCENRAFPVKIMSDFSF